MTTNEIDIVVKYVDRAAAPMAETHARTEKLRSAFGRFATYAGAAFGAHVVYAGIAKLNSFMSESITKASDLNEAVNAVGDIFGSSSPKIVAWGKANASSIGLSQRAFLEMATPLGAILRNQGLSMGDVTKRTVDLTKRAADMASVFNTSVPDALDAITSGIRGQERPLERYGVSLSMAKVQAEAMAETGKKSAGSLTAQELATARLNVIMKQTNNVAGDFHRTSGELANSQRIAAAKVEDLQAKLGSRLLPAQLMMTKAELAFADVLTNRIVPVFNIISGYLMKHPILLKSLGIIVGVVLVTAFYAWAASAAVAAAATIAATWPVIAIIAAVAALAVGIHYAYTHWKAFHDVMDAVGRFMKDTLWPIIVGTGKVLLTVFRFAINAILTYISFFVGAVVKAFGWIPGLGPKLKEAQKRFDEFRDGVNRALGGIHDKTVKVTIQEQHRTDASTMSGNFVRGLATGGYAAGGGPRGNEFWTGEHGPELVDLPPGTMVHSAPDSARLAGMTGARGGPAVVHLTIDSAGSALDQVLLEVLRKAIRVKGGNVQLVLGRS